MSSLHATSMQFFLGSPGSDAALWMRLRPCRKQSVRCLAPLPVKHRARSGRGPEAVVAAGQAVAGAPQMGGGWSERRKFRTRAHSAPAPGPTRRHAHHHGRSGLGRRPTRGCRDQHLRLEKTQPPLARPPQHGWHPARAAARDPSPTGCRARCRLARAHGRRPGHTRAGCVPQARSVQGPRAVQSCRQRAHHEEQRLPHLGLQQVSGCARLPAARAGAEALGQLVLVHQRGLFACFG